MATIGSRRFAGCLIVAMNLARERGSSTLDVRDMLGALWIADLDRLSKYWRDWEEFEDFVTAECRLHEPRWAYWLHIFEASQRQKKGRLHGGMLMNQSPSLVKVWREAERLAESRNDGDLRPVLTTEDFLLAMTRQADTELSAKMVKTGLNVARLEEAVKTITPLPG